MGAVEWKYVKPNLNHKAIEEGIKKIETENDIIYPNDFKNIVKKFNNGYPVQNLLLVNGEEKVIQKLLSFDPDDRANIFTIFSGDTKNDLPEKTIPFMILGNGDLLCFNFKDNGKVFLYEGETNKITKVCDNFTKLLNSLYTDDLFTGYDKIKDVHSISHVEQKLGIKFPKEFIDFVIKRNGAGVKKTHFKISDKIYPMDRFYSFNPNPGFKRHADMTEIEVINADAQLRGRDKKLIAFATGAGGDHYCFDFNNGGKIVYNDAEYDENKWFPICNSFKDFLNILKTKSVGVHGEEDANLISETKEIITNLMFIKDHFTKFGTNKESFHLLNSNGNLSKALGLKLPYCEEDGIDVPEEEVVVPETEEVLDRLNKVIFKAVNKLLTLV